MSRMGGQALTSTAAAASLDRNNLQMSCVVIKQAERLTCGQRARCSRHSAGPSRLPAPLQVLWVRSSFLRALRSQGTNSAIPKEPKSYFQNQRVEATLPPRPWSQPCPGISEREVPARGSQQGVGPARQWGEQWGPRRGQAQHWGPGKGEAGARGQCYLHDHLHGWQRRGDVLWVWGADGDWHTACIEAAVKRRDEVYP